VNIALNLARCFCSAGHSCEIIGETHEKQFDDSASPIRINRLKLVPERVLDAEQSINSYLNQAGGSLAMRKLKYPFLHPVNTARLCLFNNRLLGKYFIPRYSDYVRRIIEEEKFDALICVVYPFDMAYELLLDRELKCCRVYYQLDPYGTNRALPESQTEQRKRAEAEVIRNSDIAITTIELYQEYAEDAFYQDVIRRITPMEFPAFIRHAEAGAASAIPFDSGYISLLYAGTLDGDNIRDTKKTIAVLRALFSACRNVKVYFMGNINNEGILRFAGEFPQEISILPEVSQDQAIATMNQSDILLNIGNFIPNMVPSKIFGYFATGKPILSFEISRSAPENRYFDRYPLKHMIYSDDDTDAAVQPLIEFLNESRGRTADQEEIEKIYHQNTVEYVADSMLKLIEAAQKKS